MSGMARQVAARVLNTIDRKNRMRKLRDYYFRDSWLRRVKNIVHVGANAGQEISKYAEFDLGVLWIEPIPHVFHQLQNNIKQYPKQKAYQALVTDVAQQPFTLNISTNAGLSSSIFDLAEHKEIWPEVDYVDQIRLVSQTLGDILASDPVSYDGLVMDTQGAELLVLKGATAEIRKFKYIKAEAANFEMYKGGTTDRELIDYLEARDFYLLRRDVFARKQNGRGECLDLLFQRKLDQ
jgi:FkbM family methyltransferase